MSSKGILRRAYDPLAKLPTPVRNRAFTLIFTRAVRFAGTAGIQFDEVSPTQVIVSLKNRPKARNHIGGLHAMAMGLVAESASGAVFGLNVPGEAIPVLKSMKLDFKKRASGGIKAIATMNQEDIARMQTEPKGEVDVCVRLEDSKGVEPIIGSMVWAWTPAKTLVG